MGRVFLAALVALLVAVPTAGAATYTVNRTDDPAPDGCEFGTPCSFREAVLAANERVGRDAIVVRPGDYTLDPAPVPEVLDDSYGDLDIRESVRIFGSGWRSARISSCQSDRAIEVHRGAVEVRDLRITGCATAADGGAIATDPAGSGSLRLVDVRLDHNNAGATGGNLFVAETFTARLVRALVDSGSAQTDGGGVNALGRLAILSSTLRDNSALTGFGGAVAARGALEISRSSLHSSRARAGGGLLYVAGMRNVRSVTASDLVAGYALGELEPGGAILADAANLTVENSTVSRGHAGGFGGGIAARASSVVRVASTTLAYNVADYDEDGFGRGGGLSSADSKLLVRDSIIVANRAPRAFNDCVGGIRSLGHNLTGRRCSATRRRTDIRTSRPRLGGLAFHGARTRSFALRRDSPAIDAGSNRCPARDQRNRPRRRRCDIGAYEFLGPAPRNAGPRRAS